MSLKKKERRAFDTALRGRGELHLPSLVSAFRALGAEVDDSTLVVKFGGVALGHVPNRTPFQLDYKNPAHIIAKAINSGAPQPAA